MSEMTVAENPRGVERQEVLRTQFIKESVRVWRSGWIRDDAYSLKCVQPQNTEAASTKCL